MKRPVIGLTMGDPAGVGPEICLKAMRSAEIVSQCTPVLFGDWGVLARVADACRLPLPGSVMPLSAWPAPAPPESPTVLDFSAVDAAAVQPGAVDAACGRAACLYIEAAARAAIRREIQAVVTAPINKESIHRGGAAYPGHTEILTAITGAARSCMMQASERMIVSFVTTHVALAEVSRHLSAERILDVIELTADAVQRIRGGRPALLVCGLNPHAGEHGLFGDEEGRLIEPAVQRARGKGLDVRGPVPPDTAFIPHAGRGADAVVCMYHDQGHIPFKMVAFDTGVNVTLGLPIVRTSVDHGTAFDIAWKGLARESSLLCAIRLALRLAA
jgi:4-hydroxythreonine-4-phosphate dehydrogenase